MIVKWRCYQCGSENTDNLKNLLVRCKFCYKFSNITHAFPASQVIEVLPGLFVNPRGWKEKK